MTLSSHRPISNLLLYTHPRSLPTKAWAISTLPKCPDCIRIIGSWVLASTSGLTCCPFRVIPMSSLCSVSRLEFLDWPGKRDWRRKSHRVWLATCTGVDQIVERYVFLARNTFEVLSAASKPVPDSNVLNHVTPSLFFFLVTLEDVRNG